MYMHFKSIEISDSAKKIKVIAVVKKKWRTFQNYNFSISTVIEIIIFYNIFPPKNAHFSLFSKRIVENGKKSK